MLTNKITIIGGSGFVGTNLCRQLAKKNQNFEIIDIKPSNQFPEKSKFGDVRNLNTLRTSVTGNVVINLAAVHRDNVQDKIEYYQTNVDGAKNVAKVCTEKNITKIIFTSSVAVYGFAKPGADEGAKCEPFNPYGESKLLAEDELRLWQKSEKNSLIIVRPTVVFGEGNRGNVFNLLSQISSSKFLMIGGGENKKSLAYIQNLVAFLQDCITSTEDYGLHNYIDTPNLSMNEIIRRVRYKLKGKNSVGPRLPLFVGFLIGYLADFASLIIGKTLLFSSIRMKKFISSTEFTSGTSQMDAFTPPFSLLEGIDNTMEAEFIRPDPQREIFYTE